MPARGAEQMPRELHSPIHARQLPHRCSVLTILIIVLLILLLGGGGYYGYSSYGGPGLGGALGLVLVIVLVLWLVGALPVVYH